VVRHRKGSLYFLPQEFSQADEDVLVTLASQLAVAIDRTRLLDRLLSSERMAAWGEMSARSAHMIGNAVFGVKGHLNELNHWFEDYEKSLSAKPDSSAAGTSDGERSADRLGDARLLMEDITRGIYRLEEILSEFRDFVLATQLHATPREINQILRTVTAESFPKHSNIDLVLNLAPNLPLILADEAKLKRAFSELIENAIDFQPQGGVLTIRTALAEPDTVRELTRGQMIGSVVQVEFIDHGPGLSEQDRERVFTPFYTRKAKGMGLGLSIVKGIIEAHHGIIREIGGSAASTERGMHQTGHGASSGTSRPESTRALRPTRSSGSGAHFIALIPAHVEPPATDGEART
jgi:signal transduction histidine kinase